MEINLELEQRLVAVCPSARQLMIQRMEFYAFIHFGINTMLEREWGLPDVDLARFHPEKLDTAQWVEAIKSAGMQGVILTCKHHDGFCLWDTRHTGYSVMNTPFGRDITAELSRACASAGLRFGIYLSPWDMHDSRYGTGKPYDDYYVAQLTELLTGYGEIFTVWLDGACGEGASGKQQQYDWQRYYSTVRKLSPQAVIAVTGPDIRWCGNEAGICRESEFSVVSHRLSDPEAIAGRSQQTQADATGKLQAMTRKDVDLGSRTVLQNEETLIWYPAEVDTSIRPRWYYHAEDDDKVKSDEALWQLYCSAVGGNTTLLLNIPPDTSGLLYSTDCQRLHTLGKRIQRVFGKSLAAGAVAACPQESVADAPACILVDDDSYYKPADGCRTVQLTITLPTPVVAGYVVLAEQITQSQRIEAFELWAAGRLLYSGTTVGYKKICPIGKQRMRELHIKITGSRIAPTLRYAGLFSE